MDVAVGYLQSTYRFVIKTYFGDGKGKFNPPVETVFKNKLGIPSVMLAGDFNGDHKLDLAVIFQFAIVVYFGTGTGKFTLGPTTGEGYGNHIFATSAVDVDGDGNLDLISSSNAKYTGEEVTVYFGHGDGTFRIVYLSISPNNGSGVPIIADFNEDGSLDLAVSDGGGTTWVLLNQGGGTFSNPVPYSLAGPAFVTADVNGDGHLDLVADNGAILLGKGDGTFTNGQGAVISGGVNLITGDFNGDGKLDLAIPNNNSSIYLLLGNGDGTFLPAITTGYGFASNFSGIGLGGFDLDGHLDLVGSGILLWHTPAGLTPPNLGFGPQKVGTTSPPQDATLVNASAAPLRVTEIQVTGANSKDFSQTNNCPSSLPPANSCQIQVTFTPTSVGDRSAALQVNYVGTFSPESVALSGTGVSPISVSLTPAQMTFPTQIVKTTSAPQTATLKNTGTGDVTITAISASAPFFQTNNCPATLPTGQACQIQVTFHPTENGLANGTLSVTDNAPNSPQTVALSGTGTNITLTPIGINFGSQTVGTSSKPVPVTLSNQGIATLHISQIKIDGANSGDFSQTNNCGSSLPVGANCTIQVTFTPTQKGQRSASLQVFDDVNPSPQQVALAGTGT